MPPPNDLSGIYYTRPNFYRVLSEAIAEISETGFNSSDRLAYWIQRIRTAAIQSMTPPHVLERTLNDMLKGMYYAKIERGGILKLHPGVGRFALDKVKPRLRAELDRRLMASRELIKLNRAAAIEKTIQRFSGWASSVPDGGTDVLKRGEIKTSVRKALVSLPFEERRVAIDQGAKMLSNLSEIIALDAGAIAGIWHSHWREPNYNYRENHKERDDRVFVVRDNWALSNGFMKVDGHKYIDDITKPGEEVSCRCKYQWVYSLRNLPSDMVTFRGREELAKVRMAL